MSQCSSQSFLDILQQFFVFLTKSSQLEGHMTLREGCLILFL